MAPPTPAITAHRLSGRNEQAMRDLTALGELLASEGFDNHIENTGGGCLVLFVELPSTIVGVSDDGDWLVCEYASYGDFWGGYDRPSTYYPETSDVVRHMKAAKNPQQLIDTGSCGYLDAEFDYAPYHDSETVPASACATCARNRSNRPDTDATPQTEGTRQAMCDETAAACSHDRAGGQAPDLGQQEYVAAVRAALGNDPQMIIPWLTSVCPECGQSEPQDDDHVLLSMVVVGCEGFQVVDPNAVGMDAPDWEDWSLPGLSAEDAEDEDAEDARDLMSPTRRAAIADRAQGAANMMDLDALMHVALDDVPALVADVQELEALVRRLAAELKEARRAR